VKPGNLRVTVFGFIGSSPESPTKDFPSQFNAFHATPTDHLALARWLLYVGSRQTKGERSHEKTNIGHAQVAINLYAGNMRTAVRDYAAKAAISP
jgi:hypothetical protein